MPAGATPAGVARLAGRVRRHPALAGFVLVLVASGLLLFRGLGRTELRNDESIYSYVAERLALTGGWLDLENPHGGPFLEKPPLKFWIVGGALRTGLVPLDETGLRAFDALFGALAFGYLFLIGHRFDGFLTGLAAVLLAIGNHALLFDHGLRSANMEAALVLAYCGGVHHFLAWAAAGSRRAAAGHALAAAGFTALGLLVKFVAIAFLPLVLGLAALAVPAWRRRLVRDRLAWAAAVLLVVAVSAPWFIAETLEHGRRFWAVILGAHVVERLTRYLDPAHVAPWSFYLDAVWSEMWRYRAWVVAGGVLWNVRTVRRRSGDGLAVTLWLVVPLALMSAMTSKLHYYFYPFLPPVALWGGHAVAVALRLLYRAGRAAGGWLAARVPWRIPRRAPAAVVGAAAVAVLVATLVHGPIAIGAGPVSFQSSRPGRPLAIAAACLVLLVAPRVSVAGLVLASLLVSDLGRAYRIAWRAAGERDGALSELVRCLGDHAPPEGPRVYVHFPRSLPLMNHVFYYFRRLPLERAPDLDRRQLRGALAGAPPAAAFVVEQEWERLRDDPAYAGLDARRMYNAFLVLPEPYCVCADRVP